MTTDVDELLAHVLQRIGGEALHITAEPGEVTVRWRRSYDGTVSDERALSAAGLAGALGAILRHEDEADEYDAAHPDEWGPARCDDPGFAS